MNIQAKVEKLERATGGGESSSDFDLTVLSDAELLRGERLLSATARSDEEEAELVQIFAKCPRRAQGRL